MTDEALRDLVGSSGRGVLVTLKRDGRPQLSNVGYAQGNDGALLISTPATTAKAVNLRRDPRASLHVAQEDFWAYAVVEGTAQLSEPAAAPDDATVDALVDYYRTIAGEHPDWDEYRAAMVAERRLVITLSIDRLYGRA